jgi:HxlR-like helix-turn-helix
MLARRLSGLVDAGLLERRRYSQRPPRYEYILTDMGREFCPVIVAMFAWGNKHFAPEGESVLLVDKKTKRAADPVLADRKSVRPLNEREFVFAAGALPRANAHAAATQWSIKRNQSPGRERQDWCAAESEDRHDYRSATQGY